MPSCTDPKFLDEVSFFRGICLYFKIELSRRLPAQKSHIDMKRNRIILQFIVPVLLFSPGFLAGLYGADAPIPGFLEWYRADSAQFNGLADGQAVVNWLPEAGSSSAPVPVQVAGQEIVYRHSVAGLNGQPALEFAGGGSVINNIGNVDFNGVSMFLVFRNIGSGFLQRAVNGLDSNTLLGPWHPNQGGPYNPVIHLSGVWKVHPEDVVGWVDPGACVLSVVLDNVATERSYINGEEINSTYGGPGPMDTTGIGRLSFGGAVGIHSDPYKGYIAEFILYQRVLSEIETDEVHNYLLMKYGLREVTPVAPSITIPPSSLETLSGETASFTVTATGTAPLTYQWRKGGVPLSNVDNISGADTATLTLANVQVGNAGSYDVVVSNAAGDATSDAVMLSVEEPASPEKIIGIVASATSELTSHNRLAAHTVDGIYCDFSFWETSGIGFSGVDDRDPAITFDMGSVVSLSHFIIWNSHEFDPAIKRMIVEVSVDGVNFIPQGEQHLEPGNGCPPVPQTVSLDGVQARYVRFDFLENWNGVVFPVIGPPSGWPFIAIDEIEFYSDPNSVGYFGREIFTDIPGYLIENLLAAPAFPHEPDRVDRINSLESTYSGDHYGQRLSGFLVPSEGDQYVFYLAADDNAELYLSTDDDPANKRLIAYEPSWNLPRQWTGGMNEATTISQPVTLVAGQRYYLEVLQKEHEGGDHLAVAWSKVGDPAPENGSQPIGGEFLEWREPDNNTPIIRSRNLAAAIREALGLPMDAEITLEDLGNLTSLDASGRQVGGLAGLEHAHQLEVLRLAHNQIADLGPLAGLTGLHTLELPANRITDISPLSGLSQLRELVLWGNQVVDLTPLAEHTNLVYASFSGCPIADFTPISSWSQIRYLQLDDNGISNISFLEPLTELRELTLVRNNISDLSPLAEITHLTGLFVAGNQLDIQVGSPAFDVLWTIAQRGAAVGYLPQQGGVPLATPLSLSGWNRDVVLENSATSSGEFFDNGEGILHEAGFGRYEWHNNGLPSSRRIQSLTDPGVLFQLQPYEDTNVLYLTADNPEGVLSLDFPARFSNLHVLAASANGGGDGSMTLRFTDGSESGPLPFHAPDWWDGTSHPATRRPAVFGLARNLGNQGVQYHHSPPGFSLHQTDIDLVALGFADKTLKDIMFRRPEGDLHSHNTALFAVSGNLEQTPYWFSDFNGELPSEISGFGVLESVQGYIDHGFTGQFLLNDSLGEVTQLVINDLPAHTSFNLDFLLAIIGSWDGSGGDFGPDWFLVRVDGVEIFKETFGYVEPSFQPGSEVTLVTGAFLGFDEASHDAAYDMGFQHQFQNIPHTASSLTVEFLASGEGWQGGLDESWAIDNLSVILHTQDEPSTFPVIQPVGPQVVHSGGTLEVSLQVDDPTDPAEGLQMGAASSDQTLIPNSNLVIAHVAGEPNKRVLSIIPAEGLEGVAAITVTVTNSLGLSSSKTFNVTVLSDQTVVLYSPNLFTSSNSEVLVPVNVKQFRSVASLQFTLGWDQGFLEFIGVESFGLPGLNIANFKQPDPDIGVMTLSWIDDTLTGVDLTDDSALFMVRFLVKGQSGQSSSIQFLDAPTMTEIANANAQLLSAVTLPGLITVLDQVNVGGRVLYYDLEGGVPGVEIQLLHNETVAGTGVSDNQGYYQTPDVASGLDYIVNPHLVDEAAANQGVSTLDILLIRRHILDPQNATTQLLGSKLIAGDVNRSGSLTTLDILLVRRLILDPVNNNFYIAGQPLWSFVPAQTVFTDPLNPWGVEAAIPLPGLTGSVENADFLGIKLGDVNHSWTPAAIAPGRYSGSVMELQIGSVWVNPEVGEAFSVPIGIKNEMEGLTSIQFNLQWESDAVEFDQVTSKRLEGLGEEHYRHWKQDGVSYLSVAWDDSSLKGTDIQRGAPVLELGFRIVNVVDKVVPITLNQGIVPLEVSERFNSVQATLLPGLMGMNGNPIGRLFTMETGLGEMLPDGRIALWTAAEKGSMARMERSVELGSTGWEFMSEQKAEDAVLHWQITVPQNQPQHYFRITNEIPGDRPFLSK